MLLDYAKGYSVWEYCHPISSCNLPGMNKKANKKKGDWGEKLAAAYLIEKGYSIIEKQWQYARYEIDLIAQKDNLMVFVEVKTRFSAEYGEPWTAVNLNKQRKICRSADYYLRFFRVDAEPQFDIVSIVRAEGTTKITHLERAFFPTLG
jgi:putative endonuclease